MAKENALSIYKKKAIGEIQEDYLTEFKDKIS
jgi:hypothetical protein